MFAVQAVPDIMSFCLLREFDANQQMSEVHPAKNASVCNNHGKKEHSHMQNRQEFCISAISIPSAPEQRVFPRQEPPAKTDETVQSNAAAIRRRHF